MRKLSISRELSLPVDAVTQTFAILAKRGVGKSYTGAVMVEEMLKAELQVVVLDPIGVFWGLRSSADGRSEGLQILVMGGDHGDVPLEAASGETVADLVVQEGLSVVLDTSLFRKGDQKRFTADFAERLYQRNRVPLHFVVDEADAFAPQRPQKGEERMLGAFEDIVRRGRARGIGVTLITQRSAVLNKDVLTQVEVLVALRTIAPQDREAIDAWIRVHGTPEKRDEMMKSLPSLPIGTAWFWSPGWLDVFRKVRIRAKETFDSSATPRVGESPRVPKKLAPVDIERIRDRIAATIERAKQEDPRELRRQIADLKKDLAKKAAPAPPAQAAIQVKERRVEVPVLKGSEINALKKLTDRMEKRADSLKWSVQSLEIAAQQLSKQISHAADAAERALKSPAKGLTARPPAPGRANQGEVNSPAASPPKDNGSLLAGERKMLGVLAKFYPTARTRAQLGQLSGYTPSGGTFGNYYGRLRREGYIREGMLDEVEITDKGLSALGASRPKAPESEQEVLDLWRSCLLAGERKMLDVLIEAYPNGLTREDLGQKTGYEHTGGTFGNYLGTLRRNRLAEVDRESVKLSDRIFEDVRNQ